ncbi:BrnA antitoxin family protein [Novosphingobium sp. FKTRR1]|uniref:BrnA antitoxin family protein n=1 Tax=Novosphingobium sp. FKTRR1 TaxID=2879118 RepID=UPI001CEFCB1C|nr:BrnA antitoxin family protein [Novosphingobium sp. FKTRR1]
MTDHAFAQDDIDSVSDNPEVTEQDLAQARPFAEVFPVLAAKLETERRLRGRPKAGAPKVSTTLRLDPDIVAHFRATGPGWQSRINAALRRAADL